MEYTLRRPDFVAISLPIESFHPARQPRWDEWIRNGAEEGRSLHWLETLSSSPAPLEREAPDDFGSASSRALTGNWSNMLWTMASLCAAALLVGYLRTNRKPPVSEYSRWQAAAKRLRGP